MTDCLNYFYPLTSYCALSPESSFAFPAAFIPARVVQKYMRASYYTSMPIAELKDIQNILWIKSLAIRSLSCIVQQLLSLSLTFKALSARLHVSKQSSSWSCAFTLPGSRGSCHFQNQHQLHPIDINPIPPSTHLESFKATISRTSSSLRVSYRQCLV